MTHLIKKSRLFPDIPSFVSGYFDEDLRFNFYDPVEWNNRVSKAFPFITNIPYYESRNLD